MRMDHFLEKVAKLHPERLAVSFWEGSRTYSQFHKRVSFLASGLKGKASLGPGDRVAVLARNCPQYVESYLACSLLGCVVVPLNYRLHPDDYLYILKDSEAKALIVEEDLAQKVEEPLREVSPPNGIWSIGASKNTRWPNFEELIESEKLHEEQDGPSEEDVWIQMYTSGTTGFPKGVLLTHRNVVSTALGLALDVPFNVEGCKVLVVAPIFHIGGLITIFASMVCGWAFHLEKEFHPLNVLKAMSQGGCTHAFMVPVMVRAILNVEGVEDFDFSNFRVLMYGAAPMPEGLAKKAKQVFGCELIQGYGLTESTGVLGLLMDSDHEICPNATCREYSMARVKVVDPRGVPVGPGQVGEIVARGDGIMKGYWKDEEETQKAFLNGWLRTGDLATWDERGYITIVDRLKDMIIKGGENIYPSEIERVLKTHPFVSEVAVIGVPDEKWGEEVMALIVPRPSVELTKEEIRRFCREKLAPMKRPRKILFRESLPMTPTGKVSKRELREEFWKGMEKRVH